MATSNVFLPSSMDKKDLLLDAEFCASLGVYPESGCCVRHPICKIIIRDDDDDFDDDEKNRERIVRTCQFCETEFLEQGHRQRQSYAVAMLRVQKLHNDEDGWMEFKKNWDISMRSCEESKDSEEGLNINFQASAEFADTPRRLDLFTPSSILRRTNKWQVAWKEYTWQVILRTTQVQEWALAEKDKEIEFLRAQLELTDSLTTDIVSTTESASLYEDNPTYMQTSVEEIPPRVPHRRSSSRFAAQNKKTSAEGANQDPSKIVAPQIPQRQRSSDQFSFEPSSPSMGDEEEVDLEFSPTNGDSKMQNKISRNSNRGTGRVVHPSKFQARVPPPMPLRQASNEGLMRPSQTANVPRTSNVSALSDLTNPSVFSQSFSTSVDSFNLNDSERDLLGGVKGTREFKSLDTIQSEEFVVNRQMSAVSELGNDFTPLSGNHRKAMPKASQASLPGPTIIEGEEISFISPVMEEPPPPPPPTREDSLPFPPAPHREYIVPLNGSSNQDIRFDASQKDIKMDASQDIKFDASKQDIKFDASQDIRFDASSSSLKNPHDSHNFFKQSSIKDMQFSDKDKLMQEASKAFSTPQSYISRKIGNFRRMSSKSKTPSTKTFRGLVSSQDFAKGESSGELTEPRRPASADDVMLKRPPNNNNLKPPPPAQQPMQMSTPPQEKKLMNLGDFLNKNSNHSRNNEDENEPELEEFGDLPVSSGFLRLDGGSSSPVSCVTMLTTEHASVFGGASVDDDEDLEPNIGLNVGGPQRLLPMEEGFHSDEESSSDEESTKEEIVRKVTVNVVDQIVNDKYGDSGLYTGSVTADGRIPHGHGVMMYENEREYNGDWSDGQWHGQGEWVNPNGDRYNGTFVFDSRHGEGTYSWRNGNMYKGEFFEDKRQGKGVFTFANGNVYEGDFINGVFEGEGKYNFGNGFYRGSWKGGKYHGLGFLQFNDGSSYSGTFVEGVAHGDGKEISSDGKITTGFWNQGVAPER